VDGRGEGVDGGEECGPGRGEIVECSERGVVGGTRGPRGARGASGGAEESGGDTALFDGVFGGKEGVDGGESRGAGAEGAEVLERFGGGREGAETLDDGG
jgi:hypothetical protein